MIANTLRDFGVLTPDEFKVPRGDLAFLVTAYNDQGEFRRFFSHMPPTNPDELREDIFNKAPGAVDYSLRRVNPSFVRAAGRQLIFKGTIHKLTGILVQPENLHLELKQDS